MSREFFVSIINNRPFVIFYIVIYPPPICVRDTSLDVSPFASWLACEELINLIWRGIYLRI